MTLEQVNRVLLKVTEAGEICGCNRSTAYKLAATEWPVIRISERAIRVDYSGLMEWIERKKLEAAEERETRCNDGA